MDVAPWLWWATIGVTIGLLLFDVLIIGRRPARAVDCRSASRTWRSTSALAVVFGLGVWFFAGAAVRRSSSSPAG